MGELALTTKSPVNFRTSAELYNLRSVFILNVSLSNLAVLLILRRSFQ